MGSEKFPLPLGTWEIKGPAYNPPWNFDPDLIAGTKPDAKEAVVPPGPNNPVGVVWLDLSKEHYGIHGTAEPQNIGRSESNGCIRLTNWDAARLALMVKAGTKALFQA
jgi:lipoprotein-anchoring transpeptidase ErfK/SrfK